MEAGTFRPGGEEIQEYRAFADENSDAYGVASGFVSWLCGGGEQIKIPRGVEKIEHQGIEKGRPGF